jgi:hypothetical protein
MPGGEEGLLTFAKKCRRLADGGDSGSHGEESLDPVDRGSMLLAAAICEKVANMMQVSDYHIGASEVGGMPTSQHHELIGEANAMMEETIPSERDWAAIRFIDHFFRDPDLQEPGHRSGVTKNRNVTDHAAVGDHKGMLASLRDEAADCSVLQILFAAARRRPVPSLSTSSLTMGS